MKAKMSEIVASAEQRAPISTDSHVAASSDGMVKPALDGEAKQFNVKQGMEKAMKTAQDIVAFGQGNIEAFMQSGQIWTTGVQGLSKHIASAAQVSMEESMANFKALAGVKSLKDAFDLQSAFARATLEKTLAQSGKLTDASIKLAEQAMAPMKARVTVAVEKITKAA